jgi:hypothetical protein
VTRHADASAVVDGDQGDDDAPALLRPGLLARVIAMRSVGSEPGLMWGTMRASSADFGWRNSAVRAERNSALSMLAQSMWKSARHEPS